MEKSNIREPQKQDVGLNIVYSSDNNYVQHMGVSIYSLLDNNKSAYKIRIFVIDNEISDINRVKLLTMAETFKNAEIEFMPFQEWKSQLHLDMEWNISISSYARLFVGSILPESVKRVLYLDCDMIVCDDLSELWNTDLEGKMLAAVQDSVSNNIKNAVGLKGDEKYFNAGMLLLDVDKWRNEGMEQKCMSFINEHSGNVKHHDQGVLNGVCRAKAKFLPLKYNVMTIHYIANRDNILSYYHEEADYYTKAEIDVSKCHPVILHFTPSFTSRPWVKGCKHPLKNLYWETLEKTPWKGARIQKNTTRWYIKLIERWYRLIMR